MAIRKTILLGEKLIQKGLITQRDLDIGLEEHENKGQFLGTTLIKLGFIKEDDLYSVLSEQLNIPYIKIKSIPIDTKILEKVPAKYACHYKLMPINFEKSTLTVAIADPLNLKTLDDLKLLLGCHVSGVLASEIDIAEAIKKYYGIGADTIEEISDTNISGEEDRVQTSKTEDIENLAEDASIIKFVNQILLQAVKDKSTDIHIEPYENELFVRYRIDGILYEVPIPQNIKHFQYAIVSRIKIMANMDIAERRLPQDGRIKIKMGKDELDLRVSILPTQFGETVNIRLLSGSLMMFSLENLGLLPNDIAILDKLIHRPHGIIFVTGPTGSGKTTTLYSCLSKINSRDKKIITIEDPIEYILKGANQIQVHPRIGLTFANGLRSMLRHDPDIMMVGEVRDFETAEITIRVALTGHLVFSTLHTNDAAGGVTRLIDMGVEPFLVASSVECFVAQRLVRLVCPDCKVEKKPDKKVLKEFGIGDDVDKVVIYEGKGCEACKFTGYRGRTAIYEFLLMDEEIRELVLQRVSSDQIKKKALELGMNTLRMDGWEKVKKGRTTLSEIIRVTEMD